MVLEVNNQNFDKEVLSEEKTVLVDFWASWCGPCKMLSPLVDEISEEVAGSVKVCKVNVDDEEDLAMKYNIMSIPTLVVVKNGQEVRRMVGVQPKSAILEAIK